MKGTDNAGQRHWLKAAHFNTEAAASAASAPGEIDVVFYGDSITEGWRGTSFGFPVGRKQTIPAVFSSLFTLDGGGKYEGLPLGISGDTVSTYNTTLYILYESIILFVTNGGIMMSCMLSDIVLSCLSVFPIFFQMEQYMILFLYYYFFHPF